MPAQGDKFKGIDMMGGDAALAHLIGYTDHEILNADNLTPQRITNCRFVTVDIDGWVKISYEGPYGDGVKTEVKYMIGGAEYHIRNVTAWEALSVLSADDYPAAQVANSSEVISAGIKIHR